MLGDGFVFVAGQLFEPRDEFYASAVSHGSNYVASYPGEFGALDGRAVTIAREEVEDFLYREAALLDEWRLDEWLALLTDDARYRVPSNDAPAGDPADTLFLIADDIHRIPARKDEPEHLHLDVRYLVIAEDPEALAHDPNESFGAQWLGWAEALQRADEPPLRRLLEKARVAARGGLPG